MSGGHDLRQTLAELQAELRALEEGRGSEGDLPPDARRALRDAARDIERALGEDDGDEFDLESLRVRLSEAIERFEESHPTLTSVVGRVVTALSDLGI